jgi:hypothetical protein
VTGIKGFLGEDNNSIFTGIDPQEITAPRLTTVNAIVNQTDPNTLTAGGVAEFEIADPVVALQGSATADNPFLNFYVGTTGVASVRVQYDLRDIDGSTDNSIQPIALQYRIGPSGDFVNVPNAFVGDASNGPSDATLVTHIDATLPDEAGNKPQVQIRILTTNAAGADEWIGIDNINISKVATGAPTIDAASFDYDAPQQQISLDFSKDVSASFSTDDISLLQAPATFIPSGNIVVGTAPGDVITLRFQNYPFNALPDGRYSLLVKKDGVTDSDGHPMDANYPFTFFVYDGDANRDQKINAFDFNAIASHYGQSVSFTQGDFNYDGVVNTLDFNELASRFNHTLPFLPAPPAFASIFSTTRVSASDALKDVLEA